MVRYGLLDKEKALEKVKKPEIPEEIKRDVYERLNLNLKEML